MLLLWIIFALMVLLALWLVLPPLLQSSTDARTDESQEANLLVYQDQYRELEADLRNGIISEEQYQLDKSALERRLLDDTTTTGKSTPAPSADSASVRKLTYAVGAALPVLAVTFYFVVGNPKALTPQASSMALPTTGSRPGRMTQEQITQAQIEANVTKLAKKLEQDPNDAQGWIMLARSYGTMSRFTDSANAYARATALKTDDADLWADYAEAQAMANGQRMAGKPLEAANRTLQLDPKNEKGLALAGSAAFEVGDYQKAIDYWQKLLGLLPPGSEAATAVSNQLAKARQLAAGSGSR